jgi:hypothetical protein
MHACALHTYNTHMQTFMPMNMQAHKHMYITNTNTNSANFSGWFWTYIHTYIHTYMHTNVHAYIYTCANCGPDSNIHTCTRTYIHTKKQKHTYTYIYKHCWFARVTWNIHTYIHNTNGFDSSGSPRTICLHLSFLTKLDQAVQHPTFEVSSVFIGFHWVGLRWLHKGFS